MLNRCEFIGNLGADPEVRRTNAGDPIVNLRLAVGQSWRDKDTGERKERTTWVPVVIFNEGLCKVAENYLRIGSKVYVAGEFTVRKWQDRDGNDRYSTEVVLQRYRGELVLLDKGKASAMDRLQDEGQRMENTPAELDDDIPF